MQEQGDILTSWQEIADYLGVSLNTAKSWDEKDPMPIKRPGRGMLITSRAMLQAWIESPQDAFRAYAAAQNKESAPL